MHRRCVQAERLVMRGRSFLAYAIVVSVLEQVLLLVLLLVILPSAGIMVPVWVVVLCMTILAAISVVLTRLNLRTLDMKVSRSPDVGMRGQVVKALNPRGYVRVGGELWAASSKGEPLLEGQEVRVLGMEGLRLFVEPVVEAQEET